MNEQASAALDEGVAQASGATPEEGRAKAEEAREVKRWADRIRETRKFDEPAREQYAKDRRYARGDSAFEVDSNLIGTYIDILESFLYAHDPDFDVTPGPAVRPPSVESLRDAVEDAMRNRPEVKQAGVMAVQQAVAMGTPPMVATQLAMPAEEAMVEQLIRTEVERMLRNFRRRQREIKAFAETCEIVGARMWSDAALKRRGRPWVRSALTIGVGWIKASWQERTEPSPEVAQAINDLQGNIERLEMLRRKAEEGGLIDRAVGMVRGWVADDEGTLAEMQRQMQALRGQAERVVDRGFVVDLVPGEDMTVAPGYTIANYLDAPWCDHRVFLEKSEAQARFKLTDDEVKRATIYRPRKPKMVQREETLFANDTISASEADAMFVKQGDAGWEDTTAGNDDCARTEFLCLHETWSRTDNSVLTWIEGVCRWVKQPWNPPATSRFYPFFLLATSEVDGQRHPQSLVTRSQKLVDEYNRIGSAEAEHRRRVVPKTAFNAGQISPDQAKKLEKGGIQEMIPLNPTQPDAPLGNLILPVAYAALDPALYDRTRIIAEIERIWGIQEALSGSIDVAKTATEAEIQQQGFQARTGGRRDALESALGELAVYTVEIARIYVTLEDAQQIAGPDAFWPPYDGEADMVRMLSIDIRAGSSGKPNTNAERQSWSALLPVLQSGIVQIGQMRGSSPAAVADSLEQLLRITAERSGERMDIDQLIPAADGAAMPVPGMPGAPPGAAPPGAPAPDPAQPPAPAGDPAAEMAA